MLDQIPRNRLILYGLIVGLLPIFGVLAYLSSALNQIDMFQSAIEATEYKALQKEKRQATNLAVQNHYRDADHYYIDKYIETLSFLEPEVESLQKLTTSPHYIENETLKKRLELLTGSGNTLAFSEGVVQTYPTFQETTETLIHPVEVNRKDLEAILNRIEGASFGEENLGIKPPQLIILEFKIDRKTVVDSNEVYLLNLKLLKREYL